MRMLDEAYKDYPILMQVCDQTRAAWSQVDKSIIADEWWMAFRGSVPEDPEAISDLEVVVLALVHTNEQLHAAGIIMEIPNE